ncbi:MAG: hypothetical protein ACKO6N_05775 [Myxococcota bacterium]
MSTPVMTTEPTLAALALQLREQLEAKGLVFERSRTPDHALYFVYPRGWSPVWREDHLSITHGNPPRGYVTVYPVALQQKITPEELHDAFLDEFVEPAVSQLELHGRSRLAVVPSVEGVELRLQLGVQWYRGLSLAFVHAGQARVVSYWTDEQVFRRGPVQELLLLILGTLEMPASSPYAEVQAVLEPLPEVPWSPAELPWGESVGEVEGRFALRLLEGWRCMALEHEGARGWVLSPPGVEPGSPDAPFICLTSADLLTSLEQCLAEALDTLVGGETFEEELGAQEVRLKDRFALFQVRLGEPTGAPGKKVRLWSLGVTDGVTVLHLYAVAEANRLLPLLGPLAQLGMSLRVLERREDPARMQLLAGAWRFVELGDKESESLETLLVLRVTGQYGQVKRSVEGRQLLGQRPDPATLVGETLSGRWEVVDETLNLYPTEGGRELFAIESIAGRSAILGGTFWERLG